MLNAIVSAPCLFTHGVVLADAMGIQRRFDLPALLVWQRALPAIASASTESVDANRRRLTISVARQLRPVLLGATHPTRWCTAHLIFGVATSSHRPIPFHLPFHSISFQLSFRFHVLSISAR